MAKQRSDLQTAIDALVEKQSRYDLFWKYYHGEAPLVYSSEKLKEIFANIRARFAENLCAVVIDSVLDRLDTKFPTVSNNDNLTSQIEQLWQESGIVLEELNVHEDVCITGESFVIAWVDEETEEVQAYHNDSRMCHVEYSSDNPRKAKFAAKWWKDDEEYIRLTLYYEDRLEYYRSRTADDDSLTSSKPVLPSERTLEPMDPPSAENPFGRIPVFHFRSNLRRPQSQLVNAIEIQDAVNKLLADMMIAAEFGAFPQRYIITQADITPLRNNPNEIWWLPPAEPGTQPVTTGQFTAVNLGNYLEAIDRLTRDLGVITRTPKHFFLSQGGDPSGEALRSMEAPLIKKVNRVQFSLATVWEELAQFLLGMKGVEVDLKEIVVEYEPAESSQPTLEAQLRSSGRSAGIPLVTLLRREGWTREEIEQMLAEQNEEVVRQMTIQQAMLGQAETQFNKGPGPRQPEQQRKQPVRRR